MNDALILAFDPFAGDFDCGPSDRIISDKVVTARKAGKCFTCEGAITPGTKVRRRAEVFDDELMRFSWCSECCKAMAADDDEQYSARLKDGDIIRRALAEEETKG